MRPYSLTAPIKKSSDSTLELDIVDEGEMSDEDAKSDDADRMIVVC